MIYKKGYRIGDLGEFLKEDRIRENPRKKGDFPHSKKVTLLPPPKCNKYQIAILENGRWCIHDDYRGEWLDKVEGLGLDELKITEIDVIPDLDKYTDVEIPFEMGYSYFNELTQRWEENLIDKKIDEVKRAERDLKNALFDINLERLDYALDKIEGKKVDEKAYKVLSNKALKIKTAHSSAKKERGIMEAGQKK